MGENTKIKKVAVFFILLLQGCVWQTASNNPVPNNTPPNDTQDILLYTDTIIPTETESMTDTSEENFKLPAPLISQTNIGGIRIDKREYLLIPDTEDISDPGIFSPIYNEILANRWKQTQSTLSADQTQRKEAEQSLNALGYSINDEAIPCQIYQGDQLIATAWSCDVLDISFNQSGSDFVWFLPTENQAEGVLLQRDSMEPWGQQTHFWVKPKYVGDNLLLVSDVFGDKGHELSIEMDGKIIFTQLLSGPGDCLGKGLMTWNDEHWGINTEGNVIIDAELAGGKNSDKEVFGLRILEEKPIYFESLGNSMDMEYDNQTIPLEYDEIFHACYPVYQEVGVHPDIGVLSHMIWFFAVQENSWYYVEMELSKAGN